MNWSPKYKFDLPPEVQVLQRNRTITTYYAQLYQRQPYLYKWAGMAAFASFHIGEKLQMWNWAASGIKPISVTCAKKNRTIEDDFQVIRIINNKIFLEIGWVHLAFCQMNFQAFKSLLIEKGRHPIIIGAFEKLDIARQQLEQEGYNAAIEELAWEANIEILWHEQSEVVQPLFDKLSDLFARAMTLFASFDYRINHRQTSWMTRSRFVLFMFISGFSLIQKNYFLPEIINLEHRWYWIRKDILKKWKKVEADRERITAEIQLLSQLEARNLQL